MTEDKYKEAYMAWSDKTDWMQEKGAIPAKYLGMHRADVLTQMHQENLKLIVQAREALENLMRATTADEGFKQAYLFFEKVKHIK